jgi:hypothetical protein
MSKNVNENIMKRLQELLAFFFFTMTSSMLYAKDYVDPSEYMDSDDPGGGFSLFPLIAIGGVIYAAYKMFVFFGSSGNKLNGFDKMVFFVCSISILFLGIGFFEVPYKYFIFLRYAISIGAIVCLIHELQNNKEHFWKVYFIIILIVHNPVSPIHLYYKTIWLIVDFMFGVICFSKISKFMQKAEGDNN